MSLDRKTFLRGGLALIGLESNLINIRLVHDYRDVRGLNFASHFFGQLVYTTARASVIVLL